MSEESKTEASIFVLGAVIGIMVGISIAAYSYECLKQEAVKKGKAEYYLDDQYVRRWRWK